MSETIDIGTLKTHLTEWRFNARRIELVSPPGSPRLSAMPAPSSPSASILSERTHLLDNKVTRSLSPSPSSRTPTLLAVAYASVSGLLSGMCLLFAKSGVELLVLTAKGSNQFWRWESWALVGGLVVFALLQVPFSRSSLLGYMLIFYIAMVSSQVFGFGRSYAGLPPCVFPSFPRNISVTNT